MSDYGDVTEAGSIRFERLLPGSIERAWSYLTDSELRATWLAPGPMELRAGGRIELHFRHADLTPYGEATPDDYAAIADGTTLHCTVTACEPPHLLAFTWSDGSEVTMELTPQGDMTRLVLVHRRLDDRALFIDVAAGWHTHLDLLVAHAEGASPPRFWDTHEALRIHYGASEAAE